MIPEGSKKPVSKLDKRNIFGEIGELPMLSHVVCHRRSPAKTLSEGIFWMPQQQILEISDQLQFRIRWVRFMKNILLWLWKSITQQKRECVLCCGVCRTDGFSCVIMHHHTEPRLGWIQGKKTNKKSVTRERSETCWNDLFKQFLPVSFCFSSFLQDMTAAKRLVNLLSSTSSSELSEREELWLF